MKVEGDPFDADFNPIVLETPEWFISFFDPANGICHTQSCSEFATPFGTNFQVHRFSLAHLVACCIDENLQKLNIADQITYAELERKQAIHRSLTCPVCPDHQGGGHPLEPDSYYAHLTSPWHTRREKAADGYDSVGLLSWRTCREPYCPSFGDKIPPWRLLRHLHCDAHTSAPRVMQALADTGLAPGQLALMAPAMRMRVCNVQGCVGYGAASRFSTAEELLDHLESEGHRRAQRVRYGLLPECESEPERHYCRLVGCRGHASNGGNVFSSRRSYARHIMGARHQDGLQRIEKRVSAVLRNIAVTNFLGCQSDIVQQRTITTLAPPISIATTRNMETGPTQAFEQANAVAPPAQVPGQVNTAPHAPRLVATPRNAEAASVPLVERVNMVSPVAPEAQRDYSNHDQTEDDIHCKEKNSSKIKREDSSDVKMEDYSDVWVGTLQSV